MTRRHASPLADAALADQLHGIKHLVAGLRPQSATRLGAALLAQSTVRPALVEALSASSVHSGHWRNVIAVSAAAHSVTALDRQIARSWLNKIPQPEWTKLVPAVRIVSQMPRIGPRTPTGVPIPTGVRMGMQMPAGIGLAAEYLRTAQRPLLEVLSRSILPTFDPAWQEEMRRRRLLAPNWLALAGELDLARIAQLLSGGVPLAVVPRASIVQRVLAERTHGQQRRVLWRHRKVVLNDCHTVLADLSDRTRLVELLLEAVEAGRAGLWSSAQALAGNVIDTAVGPRGMRAVHEDVRDLVRGSGKAGTDALAMAGEWEAHARWVGLMLVPAFAFYGGPEGLSRQQGQRFMRHSSAHAAGVSFVYGKINGLSAVMLATAVLWLVELLDKDSPVMEGSF